MDGLYVLMSSTSGPSYIAGPYQHEHFRENFINNVKDNDPDSNLYKLNIDVGFVDLKKV